MIFQLVMMPRRDRRQHQLAEELQRRRPERAHHLPQVARHARACCRARRPRTPARRPRPARRRCGIRRRETTAPRTGSTTPPAPPSGCAPSGADIARRCPDRYISDRDQRGRCTKETTSDSSTRPSVTATSSGGDLGQALRDTAEARDREGGNPQRRRQIGHALATAAAKKTRSRRSSRAADRR